MKTSSVLSAILVGAAVVIGSTGCQHGPKNITQIPHQASPEAPMPPTKTVADNPAVPPGNLTTQAPPATGEGLPADPNINPWTSVIAGGAEDRDTLKSDTVYFDFDSATIKKSEDDKLVAVANFLKANQSDALRVEGNCDERGTERYNLSLGDRRALAIREYLANLGVDSRQVATVTYGAAKPADPGHNEAAWKKNRRGDMVVLTPKK